MFWTNTVLPVLVCAILMVAVFLLVRMNRRNDTTEYDERQQLYRGKAFRAGFLTCGLVNIFGGVGMFVEDWLQPYGGALLIGSAFLGLTVFAVIAIWTDAFHRTTSRAGAYLGLVAVVVVANLGGVFVSPNWSTWKELLTSAQMMSLCCGLCFLCVGITFLVKLLLERREED